MYAYLKCIHLLVSRCISQLLREYINCVNLLVRSTRYTTIGIQQISIQHSNTFELQNYIRDISTRLPHNVMRYIIIMR